MLRAVAVLAAGALAGRDISRGGKPRFLPVPNPCIIHRLEAVYEGHWVGRFCDRRVTANPADFMDHCWLYFTDPVRQEWPRTWDAAFGNGRPFHFDPVGVPEELGPLRPHLINPARIPIASGRGYQLEYRCPIGYACAQMLDDDQDPHVLCVRGHRYERALADYGDFLEPLESPGFEVGRLFRPLTLKNVTDTYGFAPGWRGNMPPRRSGPRGNDGARREQLRGSDVAYGLVEVGEIHDVFGGSLTALVLGPDHRPLPLASSGEPMAVSLNGVPVCVSDTCGECIGTGVHDYHKGDVISVYIPVDVAAVTALFDWQAELLLAVVGLKG